jgi:hypothetical protein
LRERQSHVLADERQQERNSAERQEMDDLGEKNDRDRAAPFRLERHGLGSRQLIAFEVRGQNRET